MLWLQVMHWWKKQMQWIENIVFKIGLNTAAEKLLKLKADANYFYNWDFLFVSLILFRLIQ